MADHFVYTRAYAPGKALVAQRSRPAAVACGVVVDQFVYVGSRHACTNVSGHVVEHGGVQASGAADAFDLFGSLDQFAAGHEVSLVLQLKNASVEVGGGLAGRKTPVPLDFPHR